MSDSNPEHSEEGAGFDAARDIDKVMEQLRGDLRQQAIGVLERARARAAEMESEALARVTELEGSAERRVGELLDAARHGADELLAEAQAEAQETVDGAQADADQILSEARSEAEATLRDARSDSDRIRSEAERALDESESDADRILSEAQSEAEQMVGESRVRVEGAAAELTELLRMREQLFGTLETVVGDFGAVLERVRRGDSVMPPAPERQPHVPHVPQAPPSAPPPSAPDEEVASHGRPGSIQTQVDLEPIADFAGLAAAEEAIGSISGIRETYLRRFTSGTVTLEVEADEGVDVLAACREVLPRLTINEHSSDSGRSAPALKEGTP